jgi:hypothetical protein
MRRIGSWFWLILLMVGLGTFTPSAKAVGPVLPTFDPNSSTGVYFNGEANSTIQVSTGADFEIGCNDFTVSWWQKATYPQIRYGRLFQFGEGMENSDAFAVSEESGSLYLWLNNNADRTGIASLASIPLPDTPTDWNHLAIVRFGQNISIYLNGTPASTLVGVGPSICAPSGIGAQPLLIGGSNDVSLGAFQGEVTGFEFFKGARWTNTFTPPTQFSTDPCQRLDESNACTLTSLLLLYPTEDFKASGRTLNNLISNDVFIVSQSVTYGNGQSPPAPPEPPTVGRIVELVDRPSGIICLLDTTNREFCTGSNDQSVVIPIEGEHSVLIEADLGYAIDSITISAGSSLLTTNDFIQDFTFIDDLENSYIFQWDDNLLLLPEELENFSIDLTFKAMNEPSMENPSIISNYSGFDWDEPFQIRSADPLEPIDYAGVSGIMLEIRYRNHDPINSEVTPTPLFCRKAFELGDDFEISDDLSKILFWLPPSFRVLNNCPGYHQRDSITQGRLYLSDIALIDADDLGNLDPSNILQEVAINIVSPPGIQNLIDDVNVVEGQIVAVQPSNKDAITDALLAVVSSNFRYGACGSTYGIRYPDDSVISEYEDEDGNILFRIPTFEFLNSECSDEFIEGVTALDDAEPATLSIRFLDDNLQSENSVTLYLQPPLPAPIPEPTPAMDQTLTPLPIRVYVPIPDPIPDPIPEPTPGIIQNPIQDISPEATPVKIPVKEKVVETTWCTTKGIWVYTVSGKLRLCDPKNNLALEIPACAGKVATPTYPWIFKPQRFISGASPSKSGKELHNAVFFFKGLAISGAPTVSSKPCSKGSVFIPMKYSKIVYNFARSQKPLIWVKAT